MVEHFSITVTDDNEYFETHDHVAGFCRRAGDKNVIFLKKEHFMSETPTGLSTLVHELGHAVYNYYSIHKPQSFAILESSLKRVYYQALNKGLWQKESPPGTMGTSITHYARESMFEYWAEGVRIFANYLNISDSDFLDTERKISGREFLKEYDPELYRIICKWFNIEESRQAHFFPKNNSKKSSSNRGGYRLSSASPLPQKPLDKQSVGLASFFSSYPEYQNPKQKIQPLYGMSDRRLAISYRNTTSAVNNAQFKNSNSLPLESYDFENPQSDSVEDFTIEDCSEYETFFEILENENAFTGSQSGASREKFLCKFLTQSNVLKKSIDRKKFFYWLLKNPDKKHLMQLLYQDLSWSERLFLWLSQLGDFGQWLAEVLFLVGSDESNKVRD